VGQGGQARAEIWQDKDTQEFYAVKIYMNPSSADCDRVRDVYDILVSSPL
jgi:hypothetical protein